MIEFWTIEQIVKMPSCIIGKKLSVFDAFHCRMNGKWEVVVVSVNVGVSVCVCVDAESKTTCLSEGARGRVKI